jgi:hypothetical protein
LQSSQDLFLSLVEQMDPDRQLYHAIEDNDFPRVQWLIQECGANVNAEITIVVGVGVVTNTPLRRATKFCKAHGGSTTFLWLVEHGGADITLEDINGRLTVWYFLRSFFLDLRDGLSRLFPELPEPHDDASPTMVLLRAMLLQGAPPDYLVAQFGPWKKRSVQEGARLRERLPAYLVQRRTFLDSHCPLPAPLRAIVTGYQEPTTTEELWATGIGQAP